MSDQQTAAAEQDADDGLVWAQSPATGRKKQMTPEKLEILQLSGWKSCAAPDEHDTSVVPAFPTTPPDEVAAAAESDTAGGPAENAPTDGRPTRKAAPKKEDS